MFPPIYQTLAASSAVAALLGGSTPRVYRHGHAPQGTQHPYVTWSVISDVPENNLSDLPPAGRVTVQVDCFHAVDAGVITLATAVRDALEPVCHMTGMPIDQREADTMLYRIALQFDYWLSR